MAFFHVTGPAISPPMSADAKTLDVTGYRCPMPVIRMEAVLRELPAGAQLTVFADDPIAAIDIPHSCREGGHDCRRLEDRGATCVFLVTRGPKQ